MFNPPWLLLVKSYRTGKNCGYTKVVNTCYNTNQYYIIINNYIYIWYPPKTYFFTIFTGIYGVLCIFGGILFFYVFLNKIGHRFEGEYHIYIYVTVDVDKLVRHDGSGVKRS